MTRRPQTPKTEMQRLLREQAAKDKARSKRRSAQARSTQPNHDAGQRPEHGRVRRGS
jgi:hypothetical protein